MLCPHCNAESIPLWARASAVPVKPVICPRCDGKSVLRNGWIWLAVLNLLLFGSITFLFLLPYWPGRVGVGVAVILLCAGVVLTVPALLPLVPVREADARSAARWRYVLLGAFSLPLLGKALQILVFA